MTANHFVFALWTVLSAAASAAGQPPAVTVRVYDYAGVPEKVLQKAEMEAQRVFRTAAVETEWIDCPVRGELEALYPACRKPGSLADVVLRIIPPTMDRYQGTSHSFGYALPFQEGRPANFAYILYDHVRRNVREHEGISEFRLLGYVMVHEVAHLFLGHDRHSPRGIMTAFWGEKDLAQIQCGTLKFTGGEAALLQPGVAARVVSDPQTAFAR